MCVGLLAADTGRERGLLDKREGGRGREREWLFINDVTSLGSPSGSTEGGKERGDVTEVSSRERRREEVAAVSCAGIRRASQAGQP